MTPFGTTKRGEDVHAIPLTGHGLSVTILTYGAIVQDVRLDGINRSLTVGSDTIADYEGEMRYHGAIVGPVANRISGGTATINGFEHQLERNFIGKHTLHGGTRGLQTRIWSVEDRTDTTLTLSLSVPDGDFGLPGNRIFTAQFSLSAGPALTLSITTTTDEDTYVNATNHSYWNLSGDAGMEGHILRINAESYLPTTDESLPTGEIRPVDATAFDFRSPTPLVLGETAYDNTFVVADARRDLTPVLTLSSDTVEMTVATTEPGVHIYDDRPDYSALAIECQVWPDAPAHPRFPSVDVTPDAPVTQTTQWTFARR
ncbi:aldose epimerase family protein [Pseudooctadecabacter sp.]|uniref:aldose epimerase family protein n=1 Tax=Pseudooctadecabacter sp. TaxID=1966338 RepID=UPI0025D22E24|nr:aldose epimerase family protein [Pseudooctadecabacter sp.]